MIDCSSDGGSISKVCGGVAKSSDQISFAYNSYLACPRVTCPISVGFKPTVLASTVVAASQLNFNVIITFLNCDIKNLIVMWKLEPRTVGLKLT